MSKETNVKTWIYQYQDTQEHMKELMEIPKEIRVFELKGPLFFAVSDTHKTLTTKNFTKRVILRMRSVPMVDTDALRSLKKFVEECKAKEMKISALTLKVQ